MKKLFMFALMFSLLLTGCNSEMEGTTKNGTTSKVSADNKEKVNTIEGNWSTRDYYVSISKDGDKILISSNKSNSKNRQKASFTLLKKEGNILKIEQEGRKDEYRDQEIEIVNQSIIQLITRYNDSGEINDGQITSRLILVKTDLNVDKWKELDDEDRETYMDELENDWDWDDNGVIRSAESRFKEDVLIITIEKSSFQEFTHYLKITGVGKGYIKGVTINNNREIDEDTGKKVKLTILNPDSSDGKQAKLEIEGSETLQFVED